MFFAPLLLFVVFMVGVVILVAILVIASTHRKATPAAVPVSQQAFHFPHLGVDVFVNVMAIRRRRSQYDYYIELRTIWPDPDFRLEIYPEGRDHRNRRLPGMAPVAGEASSAALHFAVQSNDATAAQSFLSDNVQQQINSLYRFAGSDDVYVAVSGGALLIRKFDPTHGGSDPRPLAEQVAHLHESALSAVEVGMGLHLQSAATSLEQAVCEICGESIHDDVVYCTRCRTPHHRECWEYYGGCSIYACGEKTYARSTTPISDLLRPKNVPRPLPTRHRG